MMDSVCSPLQTVDELFRQWHENSELPINLGDFAVNNFFDNLAQDPVVCSAVPVFSKDLLGNIAHNSLVVYRGLVHDIYDPEFYTAAFKNKNGKTQLAMYRDTLPQLLDDGSDAYDNDESNDSILERLTVLCCAVPGESSWLKEANSSSVAEIESASSRRKRSLHDDDEFEMNENSPTTKKATGASSSDPTSNKVDQSPGTLNVSYESLSNAALIKFYHQMDELRLNDMVECLCIYTADPLLDSSSTAAQEDAEMWGGVCYPPASVAPRLHCLTFRRLGASFPWYGSLPSLDPTIHTNTSLVSVTRLPQGSFRALAGGAEVSLASVVSDRQAMRTAREQMLSLLTESLRGDRLAAEYLLLTMLSRRLNASDSAESEGVMVGMIALQFTGLTVSDGAVFVQDVQVALSQVLPRVVRVTTDSSTLNSSSTSYQPSKNYDNNTMTHSPLRMGLGTVLLVDASRELQTQQTQSGSDGQNTVGVALNVVGAKSARAVRAVVAEQKLIVNCGYSDVVLRTESPCIVFTAGHKATQQFGDESELITLPMQSSSSAMDAEEEEDDLVVGLSETQLDVLRRWWGAVRLLDTAMSDTMLKYVENDYVQARQSDASITGVDFHRWVNMVRLLAASYGETDISEDHWRQMRKMERDRVSRVIAVDQSSASIAVTANRVPFSPNSVAVDCGVVQM